MPLKGNIIINKIIWIDDIYIVQNSKDIHTFLQNVGF